MKYSAIFSALAAHAFLLRKALASCTVDTPSIEQGCHGWWNRPSSSSCPSGYSQQKYGSCSCRWGICTKSNYRCINNRNCCDGWTGGLCDLPVCSGGCNLGECVGPDACECREGYLGDSCEVAPLASLDDSDELTVLTINFACRDVDPLAACDNCQTRFDLIAEAFNEGSTNAEGLPDLNSVDVVLAQELGTEKSNFDQISSALEIRGFIYTTGAPGPVANDRICDDPLTFDNDGKELFASLSGLRSGGLVTWSKHPINAVHKQNWCAHLFPSPSGYLVTLLDVGGGRSVVVFNLHAMPEYDLGIDNSAEGVRAYQFGELSGLAGKLSENFSNAGIPYSVLLGGDFNEDAYGKNSQRSEAACDLITSSLVQQKFESIGLDIKAACEENAIGVPTWDPWSNDLADRFSDDSTHEVLDYLIQHSSSHASLMANNAVSVFKTKDVWTGEFCDNTSLGGLIPGNLDEGEAHALTDHNIVTATFKLPNRAIIGGNNDAVSLFDDTIFAWDNGLVDETACGQEASVCWTDDDCCDAEYSWTGQGQHCNGIYCKPCSATDGPCELQLEGSSCCGYDDYTSGQGTYCETNLSLKGMCILKFAQGGGCTFDEECQSHCCSGWLWWRRCE